MNVTFPGVFGRKSDAVITKWYGEDGKTVQEGEPLYAFEAFKASSTHAAPATGVFYKKVEAGTLVRYGQVIAEIVEDA